MLKGLYVAFAATISLLSHQAYGRNVYAHYMLAGATDEHINKDIDDAKTLGLDAFALNIGDPSGDWVSKALTSLFSHAENVGFKLFISMDLVASEKAPSDYQSVFDAHLTSSAYLKLDGRPLISTFGNNKISPQQFSDWKTSLGNIFFMPNLDRVDGYYASSDSFWSQWASVVDGVFSWESAWPSPLKLQKYPGDTSSDQVIMAAASKNQKAYMMPVSPVQFKAAYGAHIYRPGSENLVVRMSEILAMSNPPEYIEIITWNDGPESHYIGNVWPEANTDAEANRYGGPDRTHDGWATVVKNFIQAYKSNTNATGAVGVSGALWYKRAAESSPCKSTIEQSEMGDGFLYGAVSVPSSNSGYKCRFSVNGEQVGDLVSLDAAFGHCKSAQAVSQGTPKLEIVDGSGASIASAQGKETIHVDCPNNLYDMNPIVVPIISAVSSRGRYI